MKISQFFNKAGFRQRSIINPLILGLVPAVVILLFEPIRFRPLDIALTESAAVFFEWFEDVEGDGKPEKFRIGYFEHAPYYIYCFNEHNELLGQTNLQQNIPESQYLERPLAIDVDKDGVKDLLLLSQSNDSIFMNVFSYALQKFLVTEVFVNKVGGINNKTDFRYFWLGALDANNDGVEEAYFSIFGGYAIYPRRLFRYDYVNNEVLRSVNTGAASLFGKVLTSAADTLILIGGNAANNTQESFPYGYRDTCSWLFGFDKNLNFVFPPHSFGKAPSAINSITSYKDNAYFVFKSEDIEYKKSALYKLNSGGQFVDSLVFDGRPSYLKEKPFDKGKYLIDFYDLSSREIDFDKFVLKKRRIFNRYEGNTIFNTVDIDKDGKNEAFVYDSFNKKLIIISHKASNVFRFDLQTFLCGRTPITFNYDKKSKSGKLLFALRNGTLRFDYSKNPYYILKYPFWFTVYLFSVLFVALILFYQNSRNEKRHFLEEQIADLQLQNLRAQLDPHFTFNALNSVGNAIYKEDKEVAYDLFQRFTRMIRSSLLVTDKVFRSLDEELDFTRDYLEFQKMRFKTRFDYSIKVDNAIPIKEIQIPKMLIQNFAENAVKHAFYGVDNKGDITIKIFSRKGNVQIHIEDNGIGITSSKANSHTSGTQRGEEIIRQQIAQINKMYDRQMSLNIFDKSESSQESGTLVVISMA